MRSQRSGLVQTEAQYKFVYLAIEGHIETIHQRLSAEKVQKIHYGKSAEIAQHWGMSGKSLNISREMFGFLL